MGRICERASNLNLERMTAKASHDLVQLDDTYIGTKDYMGLTYFWAYEYRHYLRDSTFAARRRVHKKLLEAGLEISGESDNHLAIIKLYSRIPKCFQ